MVQFSNRAVIEMFARSDSETIHVVLARIVASMNSAWVTRGSMATTFRFTFTIVHPSASCARVSVAVVIISPSVKPIASSSSVSAKEKLLACAVAISAGGSASRLLVTGMPKEASACFDVPLSVVPILKLPVATRFQWTDACLMI